MPSRQRLTATSADGCCTKWRIVAVVGLCGVVCGPAKGVAEGVDGLALEASSDVGVHRGRDADVGVAEKFLDDDEFDAVLQKQGRCRMPKIMEADAAEPGLAKQGVEVSGERGSLDRGSVGPSEDVAAVLPVRSRRFAFLALLVAVPLEGARARRGRAAPL